MKDIASSMATRIRNSLEAGSAGPSMGSAADRASRQSFKDAATLAMSAQYGVSLDDVTATLPTGNDIVWQAAEGGVGQREFVITLASQHALKPLGNSDSRDYTAGENRAKLAVAEFARSVDGWTFSNGSAVSRDGDDHESSVVIMPFFDEIRHGWTFQSAIVAMDKDSFLALSADEAARIPFEDVVTGDIGDCAERAVAYQQAPASLGM